MEDKLEALKTVSMLASLKRRHLELIARVTNRVELDSGTMLIEQGQNLTHMSIIITGHADVRMAVQAMQSGAIGLLEKPYRPQDLLELIQKALKIDRQSRRDVAERADVSKRLSRLTAREREVFDLVVTGLTNRQIAEQFNLSVKTVEIHRSHAMKKLRAKNVPELVRMSLVLESAD